MNSDAAGGDILLHYQLALAYSLHAHSAQEVNQKIEVVYLRELFYSRSLSAATYFDHLFLPVWPQVILHDIECALDSWSRICVATNLDLEKEKVIQLLCSIADLAGLKVCFSSNCGCFI